METGKHEKEKNLDKIGGCKYRVQTAGKVRPLCNAVTPSSGGQERPNQSLKA